MKTIIAWMKTTKGALSSGIIVFGILLVFGLNTQASRKYRTDWDQADERIAEQDYVSEGTVVCEPGVWSKSFYTRDRDFQLPSGSVWMRGLDGQEVLFQVPPGKKFHVPWGVIQVKVPFRYEIRLKPRS